VGHALDATAAKDAVWEVDDDLDGAVNWREFRAAAARVRWGGGGGVFGSESNPSPPPPSVLPLAATPASSPTPLQRSGGSSSAILLDAASDAHPRTLVDIGLFLARADVGTGRLATSALERAAHLRAGRGAARSELADAAGAAAAAAASASAAAAGTSSSLSLVEYLEARRTAQARALRAPPPSPSLAFSQQQPPSQQPSSSQAAAATFSKMKGGGRSASSGVKPPRGRARTSKIAAPRR